MGFIVLLKVSLICIDLLAWPVLGLVYPLLASIRAIESCSKYHLRKLAIYWTLFSLISLFEFAFVKIIEWIPFWSSIKLVVTIWLVLPKFDGANVAYECIVRPWLLVSLRAMMDRFYEPKKEKLHNIETFLDVADKYIKENGYEALEKLISIQRDCQVLENSPRDILVLESEKKVVAAVSEQVQEDKKERNVEEIESDSFHSSSSATLENACFLCPTLQVQKQNSKPVSVTAAEIQETTPPQDSQPKTPPVKKIEQEWKCVLCQVKTTCENNLKSHLQGKKHKLMCDSLKESFKENKGKQEPKTTAPQETRPKTPPVKKIDQEWNCVLCQVKTTSENDLKSHLRGQKHKLMCDSLKESLKQNKGKQEADKSKTGEGSQQIPHKKTEEGVKKQNANQQSKLWCKVCGLKLNSETDMAVHVKGRRHSLNMEIKLKAAAGGSS